jgi:hypothetical protein
MPTQAQIIANPQNTQSSTGPKSPGGKAASSANSTKHGLSSAFTVLRHEDQEEFDDLMERLAGEHKAVNYHQCFLIDQIAKTWWLLARAQRLETKAFEHLSGAQFDPEDADGPIITQMFKTNPGGHFSFFAIDAHVCKVLLHFHGSQLRLPRIDSQTDKRPYSAHFIA